MSVIIAKSIVLKKLTCITSFRFHSTFMLEIVILNVSLYSIHLFKTRAGFFRVACPRPLNFIKHIIDSINVLENTEICVNTCKNSPLRNLINPPLIDPPSNRPPLRGQKFNKPPGGLLEALRYVFMLVVLFNTCFLAIYDVVVKWHNLRPLVQYYLISNFRPGIE